LPTSLFIFSALLPSWAKTDLLAISLAIGVYFTWLHHLQSTLDVCDNITPQTPQTISEVELFERKFAELNIKGDSSNSFIVKLKS
jgi:hypothetical protein